MAAFAIADLIQRSKDANLPALETLSKAEIDVVFKWIEDGLTQVSAPVAAIANPVLEMVKAELEKKV